MHKVFVSFHHANDQKYKEGLVSWAEKNKVFIDGSVDMGEIPEDWDDQKIREYIRDEHLKDTTVTILLVGTETKNRKHIDWELYSSMYDGTVNKKSGIIVILLPSVKSEYYTCAHSSEKTFYPETTQWMSIDSREEYHRRYPYLPERIIDNLRLSGNIWLVSFKISYLCLPLFYETRTTPSCHPSGCAYRQL